MEELADSVVGAIINTQTINCCLSITVSMQSGNELAYTSSVFFKVGNIDYQTIKLLLTLKGDKDIN